jgi:pilus assembly protein CpaE
MAARILLVSADSGLQGLIAGILQADGHELLSAPDGRDGLRRWSADRPDLVAVDATLPGREVPDLVRLIRDAEPPGTHVGIVVIGTTPRVEERVAALRLGADDFVARSQLPELGARVRGLLARFTSPQAQGSGRVLGRVLPFFGAKGGVGSTTLAINTAIALRSQHKRSVVLVDADLQFGDHRVFLDLGPDKRSIVDAVTATAIDQEVLRRVVVPHDTGVDLLLAPPSPEAAERVSAEQHHMLRLVEVLRTMYDYVLVDLEERLDDHTLDVIGAADSFFVVITADLSCLKNVRLLLDTMAKIGVPEERMQLVLNRENAFTGISARSIESVLQRKIAHKIVNDYRVAISSLNSGAPFMVHRPESALAKATVQFAREVDRQAQEAAGTLDEEGVAEVAPAGDRRRRGNRSSVLRRGAVSRR